MRLYLLAILLFMGTSVLGQGNGGREISTDPQNGSKSFRGDVSFEDLIAESSFTWFQKGVNDYKPDTTAINYLKKHLPKYKLVIAMGTWCSDSHDLLPKLYKTLLLSNYPMSNYYMFGVNRAKESLNAESKLYKITNAPTFIIYKGHTEIGRITESVNKSIEADLQAILEKDNS